MLRTELRRARLQFKKGQMSAEDYEKVINDYMRYANDEQERIGLDVFVHGEPERTDMCAHGNPINPAVVLHACTAGHGIACYIPCSLDDFAALHA